MGQEGDAWVDIPSEEQVRSLMPPGHPYDFGFLPAMARLVAAHPGVAPHFMNLFAQIMFAPGALARPEREMIAATAASAQECFYWTQSHAEFLRAEGGDDELARAIKERRWRDLTDLSERQRALLTVAEKLSAEPTRMVQSDWEPLRKLGLDDAACLEVAHIVGIFNYLTRLADGFGLALDAGTQRAAETGARLERRSAR